MTFLEYKRGETMKTIEKIQEAIQEYDERQYSKQERIANVASTFEIANSRLFFRQQNTEDVVLSVDVEVEEDTYISEYAKSILIDFQAIIDNDKVSDSKKIERITKYLEQVL